MTSAVTFVDLQQVYNKENLFANIRHSADFVSEYPSIFFEELQVRPHVTQIKAFYPPVVLKAVRHATWSVFQRQQVQTLG